jgi:hypothetical protein
VAAVPRAPRRDYIVKPLLLLIVVGCLLLVTAALFVLMLRRDEPMFGLGGLVTATAAAVAALPYSAIQEF